MKHWRSEHESFEVHLAEMCPEPLSSDGVDVLIAQLLKRNLSREINLRTCNPDISQKPQVVATTEWETSLEKTVRYHIGTKTAKIRKDFPHRFVGSRFVSTMKARGW